MSMNFDEFIGQVQHRARLSDRAHAERATRAVLETLAQRLSGGEPKDIASQLPPEIGRYLLEQTSGEGARFGARDFYDLVAMREGVEISDAAYHTRAVASVLRDAISPGEWRNILAQLPPDLDRVFESGSEGAGPSL
jgi:uncharacterized protein (DUF2267 family)